MLSWSPLGLAKHRRPVLAVLTTNMVLSLWASASDLRVASTWERVLVVNKSIGVFYQDATSLDGKDVLKTADGIRRSSRVRSMSWALPKIVECSNLEGLFHDNSSKQSSPVQYLAVTNDADDVVILKIKSPWLPHETLSWEAQVQSQFSWKNLHLLSTRNSETTPLEADRPAMTGTDGDQWISLYSSSMKQKAFIDRVMCMPCQTRKADLGLVLRKDRQTLRFEISYDCIPESSPIHKWMPVFSHNEITSSKTCFPCFVGGFATIQVHFSLVSGFVTGVLTLQGSGLRSV